MICSENAVRAIKDRVARDPHFASELLVSSRQAVRSLLGGLTHEDRQALLNADPEAIAAMARSVCGCGGGRSCGGGCGGAAKEAGDCSCSKEQSCGGGCGGGSKSKPKNGIRPEALARVQAEIAADKNLAKALKIAPAATLRRMKYLTPNERHVIARDPSLILGSRLSPGTFGHGSVDAITFPSGGTRQAGPGLPPGTVNGDLSGFPGIPLRSRPGAGAPPVNQPYGPPQWGVLANPGFEGVAVKSTFFFAGEWAWNQPASNNCSPVVQGTCCHPPQTTPGGTANCYGEIAADNTCLYTLHPASQYFYHLQWGESDDNKDAIVSDIVDTGFNVIEMSSWAPFGGYANDPTVPTSWGAPMCTSPGQSSLDPHVSAGAEGELFEAARRNGNVLVLPWIEGSVPKPLINDENDYFYAFWLHLGKNDNLLRHICSLVARYLPIDSAHWYKLIARFPDFDPRALFQDDFSAWWAQLYDREGNARFAIALGFVFSALPDVVGASSPDAVFASLLADLANLVRNLTGHDIGFLLDVYDPGCIPGDPPWLLSATEQCPNPPCPNILCQSDVAAPTCPSSNPPFCDTDPSTYVGNRAYFLSPEATSQWPPPSAGGPPLLAIRSYRSDYWGPLGSPAADPYVADADGALQRFWCKRCFLLKWIATGIPVILDFTTGYDGHLVFPGNATSPPRVYGNDDVLRNDQASLRGLGQMGLAYTGWNAFTEGQAGMPTQELGRDGSPGDAWNVWLRWMLNGDARLPFSVYFLEGQPATDGAYGSVLTVYGLIGQKWVQKGGIRGPLGPPHQNEEYGAQPNTLRQFFSTYGGQHGVILWRQGDSEAFEVHGAIFDTYSELGLDAGTVGLPVSDEHDTDESSPGGLGGRVSDFENGSIYWYPSWPTAIFYPGVSIGQPELALGGS